MPPQDARWGCQRGKVRCVWRKALARPSCTCDDSSQNYNNGAIAIDQTMYGWAMEFLDNFVS